eukprot:1579675-Prymnesium_polylepis.2
MATALEIWERLLSARPARGEQCADNPLPERERDRATVVAEALKVNDVLTDLMLAVNLIGDERAARRWHPAWRSTWR